MWRNTCIAFAIMWGVLGLFVWPLLFFAAISLMMLMIPVGVPPDGRTPMYTRKHDPDAWRNSAKDK